MVEPASIDPEALRLMRAGNLHEALPRAQRAVAGARTCRPGHALLASILSRLGRAEAAERVVREAAALEAAADGGAAAAYDGLAYVAVELALHGLANDLYRRAVALEPHSARFWYNLAASERGFGRLEDAERACDSAIDVDGRHYPSHLLRSELRVQTRDANHVATLRAQLAHPHIDGNGRVLVGYALAKELDDLQRFDEAFGVFAVAARERRSQLRYDVAHDERLMRRIAEVFGESVLSNEAGSTAGAAHVFIVGLPRSGTTLVERILSGLEGVHSNGETEHFSRALTAAARPAALMTGEDIVARAAAADTRMVAATYDRLARAHMAGARGRANAGGDVRCILEKLPSNYLYIGAIRRALPAAKIVLVSRSPLDSCFALYRSLFGEAYPFSYDFAELGRYYAAYERLMSHWRLLFADSLHEVVYEDLVREPGRVGRALADYCGLPWTDAALDIQSNRAVSLTASAVQVRRPIYASSSGRWRRYEAHLRPLLAALRAAGVALPAEP